MDEFTEYVAYNQYGGTDRRLPRELLESWLASFELDGTLALGVWELRRAECQECIDVRLSPKFEIDGRDTNWSSWNYSFEPLIH